jgi:hypothetical protein
MSPMKYRITTQAVIEATSQADAVIAFEQRHPTLEIVRVEELWRAETVGNEVGGTIRIAGSRAERSRVHR